MKRKIFSILFTVVLVLSFSLVTAVPASAATINVPDDYNTIQDAIDAAQPYDTISVAAGTYAGFTVNKTVTLLGAQANVDPAGATYRGASDDSDESVITRTVTITAAGATINGFKLDGNRIFINGAADVTVSYNIIVDSSMHGIRLNPSSPNADIVYNSISSPNWEGICNYVGNSGVNISHNHIEGIIEGITGSHAIVSGMHMGNDIQITYNIISNCVYKGINYWGAPGAVINHNVISDTGWEAIYTDTKATIVGNVISNCLNGINLYQGADKSTVINNEISDCSGDGILLWADVSIVNNTISGCVVYGVTVIGNGNRIINNDISNCFYGVVVFGENNKVINNDISGCDYDIYAGENNKVHNN